MVIIGRVFVIVDERKHGVVSVGTDGYFKGHVDIFIQTAGGICKFFSTVKKTPGQLLVDIQIVFKTLAHLCQGVVEVFDPGFAGADTAAVSGLQRNVDDTLVIINNFADDGVTIFNFVFCIKLSHIIDIQRHLFIGGTV